MAVGQIQTEDDLREFVRSELRGSDLATFVRQLQGLFGKARISWGLIRGSDGVRLAGTTDYTSSRTSAGIYTITWATAKAGTAYAILIATANGASGLLVANYFAKVAASFGGQTLVSNTGVNADPADWSFLVVDAQ